MATIHVAGNIPVKHKCTRLEDWDEWDDQTREIADMLNIWRYIDPDGTDKQPEAIKDSEYPTVAELTDDSANARWILELSSSQSSADRKNSTNLTTCAFE